MTNHTPEDVTQDRLEAMLRSVGRHLDVPAASSDLSLTDPPSHRRRMARVRAGRVAAWAAAAALVVGASLLVPATREAIADLLGIGSTRVELTDNANHTDTAVLPHIADGLTSISDTEAATLIGGDLPDTAAASLGPHDAVYRMPEGGVLLAWRNQAATLWVHPADGTEQIFTKLVDSTEHVAIVDGLADRALVITEPHILQTPRRRVAAESVVLWLDGDIEYRLEADLPADELIELARTID